MSVNMTAEVIILFLTNNIEIPKGAELVLQLDQVKQEPSQKKRTWKDSYAEEIKAAEKQKKDSDGTERSRTEDGDEGEGERLKSRDRTS